MKLSVSERLQIIMNLLPQEGDFSTLKTVRQAREALAFDDEPELGVSAEQRGDKIIYNWEKNEEREIDLSSRAIVLIEDALRKLETDKKLPEALYSIYEKFMEE